MWKVVALVAVAMSVAACAAPTIVREASDESTASPAASTMGATDAPVAVPVLPAFDAPYPDDGWSVAASFDGTGDVYRVRSSGRAETGALIDLAFACDNEVTMTIRAIDTEHAQVQLGSISTACIPGRINRATVPSIDNDTALGLDVTTDAPVRFWVKLGVPSDHLVAAG